MAATVLVLVPAIAGMFAAVVACAVLGGLAGIALQAENKVYQSQRNHEAERIYNSPDGPFVLYLRPFSITGAVSVDNPSHYGAAIHPGAHLPKTIDLETLIENAVSRFGALLKIGGDGTSIGAGRLELPLRAPWKEAFVQLSDRARAIVIVPGLSEGIRWELESLKERHLLLKCVLLVPPSRDGTPDWVRVRQLFYAIGMGFPEIGEQFSLSRFNNRGEPAVEMNVSRPRSYLADCVADVIADTEPDSAVSRWLVVRRWHAVQEPIIWMCLIPIVFGFGWLLVWVVQLFLFV